MESVIDDAAAPAGAARQRLAREDWLGAAWQALARGGIEHVRVEPLATSLGVTKGSFYWHFKNRGALLQAVLGAWQPRATTSLFERMEGRAESPRDQLRTLLALMMDEDAAGIERAVRAWATHDRDAANAVRQVDEARLGRLAMLFLKMGFSGEACFTRSRLAYFALLGERMVEGRRPAGEREDTLSKALDLLTERA